MNNLKRRSKRPLIRKTMQLRKLIDRLAGENHKKMMIAGKVVGTAAVIMIDMIDDRQRMTRTLRSI